MNFSILTQFLGLTSAATGGQSGRAGQAQGIFALQGAKGGASQQGGGFATLLQALGLTPGNGVNMLAVDAAATAAAPAKSLTGHVIAFNLPDAAEIQPANPGNMIAGIAAGGAIQPQVAVTQNEDGGQSLVIRGADGTEITLDAARLAEMVNGTASPEEMALFTETPLGRLLQQRPELRTLLTNRAGDTGTDAPADLLASLDEDQRGMVLAALGLLAAPADPAQPQTMPVMADAPTNIENEFAAAPAIADAGGKPANVPPVAPAPEDSIPEGEGAEGAALNEITPAAGADKAPASAPAARTEVVAALRTDLASNLPGEAAPLPPAHDAPRDPALPAAEEIAAEDAQGLREKAAPTPATEPDESEERKVALSGIPAEEPEPEPELPQAPLAARGGRRTANAGAAQGDGTSSSGATSANGAERPQSSGPAAARDNNATLVEFRRPAQQTASDMLALLRADWGSGWGDGWVDPQDGGALPGNFSALSALSAGGAGATRAAAQPVSYQFAHPVVANQVALQISRSIREGADSFQIRLDPPELGRVDVKLDIAHDGRVTAVVAVDNDQTLQMLLRDQGILERALQDAGLKTDSGSLNFSLNQGDGRGEAMDGDGRNGPSLRSREAVAAAEAAPPQPAYVSNRALDLRV